MSMDIEQMRKHNEEEYARLLSLLDEQSLLANGTRELIGATAIFEPLPKLARAKESYVRVELEWYDSMKRNIKAHPKIASNPIWQNCATEDGSVNSNYGWCVYSTENYSQYKHAINSLLEDPLSRRSVCTYIRPQIQIEHNDGIHARQDFICTFCTQHLIRDNKLEYFVYMRSNDIEYGLPYDLAWHQYIYCNMYQDICNVGLKDNNPLYKDLKFGNIHWYATSLHKYNKESRAGASLA